MEILRLKEIMKEKGISGKDLAEKVDVTPASISNIIQGIHFPKPDLLLKIAEVLGVDLKDLFNSTAEKKELENVDIFIKNKDDQFVKIGVLNKNSYL